MNKELPVIEFDKVNKEANAIKHHTLSYKQTILTKEQNKRIPYENWHSIETKSMSLLKRSHNIGFTMGSHLDGVVVPTKEAADSFLAKYNIDQNNPTFPTHRADIIFKNMFNSFNLMHNINDHKIEQHILLGNGIKAKIVQFKEDPEAFNKVFPMKKDPSSDSIRIELPNYFRPYIDNLVNNMRPSFTNKKINYLPLPNNLPIFDLLIGYKIADNAGNKYTVSDIAYTDTKDIVCYINANMVKRDNIDYVNDYINKYGYLLFFVCRNIFVPNKGALTQENTINISCCSKINLEYAVLARAKNERSYREAIKILLKWYKQESMASVYITQKLRYSFNKILDIKNKKHGFMFNVNDAIMAFDLFDENHVTTLAYYNSFIKQCEIPENFAYYTKVNMYGEEIKTPTTRFYTILKYLLNMREVNYSSVITESYMQNIIDSFTGLSQKLFKNIQHPRSLNAFYIEVVDADIEEDEILVPQILIDLGYFKKGQIIPVSGNPIHNSECVQFLKVIGWTENVLGVSDITLEKMGRDHDGDQLVISDAPEELFEHIDITIGRTEYDKYSYGLPKPSDKLTIVERVKSHIESKNLIPQVCLPARKRRSMANSLKELVASEEVYTRLANAAINTKDIDVLSTEFKDFINSMILTEELENYKIIHGESYPDVNKIKNIYEISSLTKELNEMCLNGSINLITLTSKDVELVYDHFVQHNPHNFCYLQIYQILNSIVNEKHTEIEANERTEALLDALCSNIFSI